MPLLFWRTDLGRGPVKVVTGLFVAGGDIAASEGNRVFLFVPADQEYRMYSQYNLSTAVTGMAAVNAGLQTEDIAVVTSEKAVLLGSRSGALSLVSETGPESGAAFSDVAAGDLDGDGRDEIVVAAPGLGSIYVYRLAGKSPAVSLELVGIREVDGLPRYVRVFKRPDGINVIAVAYEQNEKWGVTTYRLTSEGFEEGPGLAPQPRAITALAAGNFLERTGEELALGMTGGTVWLLGAGQQALEALLVTESLGTSVSALASSGGYYAQLAAGTPEGNAYIFDYPVGKIPRQSFSPVEGVTGLGFLPGGRVAVGTGAGGLQVWLQTRAEKTWNYTVRPGDTLWIIAARYGVTVEDILAVNETIKNPDVIMPGQVIRIPTGTGG